MSEPTESPVKRFRRNLGLKMVAVGAVGLTLFFGLCQLGFYLGRNVHDGAPSGIDTLGGFGFLLSAILFLVGILVAIVEAISNSVGNGKS
ncbi:hypothetical protein RBB75_08990 [Tunturibacter empetritectus]|uniref:Uncharacterized protein n=1 Tax=Tunturiibacter empetritectus TaxID=3069691 RepID=A0AAU7ZHB5_9BACT